MGRPTDNPKNNSVKFLADDETFEKLKECSEKLDVSRAEVIRRGIHKVYDGLDKKGKRRQSNQESRHFPSRLLPKGKNDVNIISCAGFPFKQYRTKKHGC